LNLQLPGRTQWRAKRGWEAYDMIEALTTAHASVAACPSPEAFPRTSSPCS
jgi:hypothetical protein